MDKAALVRLTGIADLLHEQNAAQLTAAQQALATLQAKRAALLQRPGENLTEDAADVAAILAQTKWGNSAETELPVLDEHIAKAKQEIDALIGKTRKSFTKVKGLENLTETQKAQDMRESTKREDLTQDTLVSLKWTSTHG